MRRLSVIFLTSCCLVAYSSLVVAQRIGSIELPFDSYGAINAEDASARLDNFAISLQNQPGALGFVIAYGPQGEGSGSGKFLMNISKSYLVNSRGIDPDRIQTIYAGRYKDPAEIFSELWIVPVGVAPPERRRYNKKPSKKSGKIVETVGWDGPSEDGCCGPSLGNVTLAAFADLLREQQEDIGYIVAFNFRGSAPGSWRRVAKREAAQVQENGIEADRIKIIYGGFVKAKEDDSVQEVKLQYWILPAHAAPPVKEAKAERTPKETVQIGSYGQYELKYTQEERQIFEGFADVLRADEQLRVCLIVRPEIQDGEKYFLPDEPPDIDQAKLVEKWKSELQTKLGIKESRIVIVHAGAAEFKGGTVEVWVVPPGAPLPDPYASDDNEMNEDPG